jgi:excisionase family DNA binding protein
VTDLSHSELGQLTWLTTRQAAKYTSHGVDTLKRAAKAGVLKSSQSGEGGWHRFHRDDLDEWMRNKDRQVAS